jgi:hypothetical protein
MTSRRDCCDASRDDDVQDGEWLYSSVRISLPVFWSICKPKYIRTAVICPQKYDVQCRLLGAPQVGNQPQTRKGCSLATPKLLKSLVHPAGLKPATF